MYKSILTNITNCIPKERGKSRQPKTYVVLCKEQQDGACRADKEECAARSESNTDRPNAKDITVALNRRLYLYFEIFVVTK